MIELLVVLAIIVILLTLVVGLGYIVIQNQKTAQTRNVLIALDRALEEYMQANGGNPPPLKRNSSGEPVDYVGVPGPDVALTDRNFFRRFPDSGGQIFPLRPDAAVFLRQARGYGEVQAILSGLSDKFLRLTTTPDGTTTPPADSNWNRDTDVTPSVVDSWSNDDWSGPWPMIDSSGRAAQQLILFVHPDNLLAQQYYGKCLNRRGYFVSAGPDLFYGLPSEINAIIDHHGMKRTDAQSDPDPQAVLRKAREDNVYSYELDRNFTVDPDLLTP